MSGELEAANGSRSGSFPEEWGAPAGSQFSEVRAAWIKGKLGEHSALRAHRTLASADGRLLAVLRRAELARRREP